MRKGRPLSKPEVFREDFRQSERQAWPLVQKALFVLESGLPANFSPFFYTG